MLGREKTPYHISSEKLGFFKRSIEQIHQLPLEGLSSEILARFQKLVIHDILLILPNALQRLSLEVIRSGERYWRLIEINSWSIAFIILRHYSFFIEPKTPVEKNFLFRLACIISLVLWRWSIFISIDSKAGILTFFIFLMACSHIETAAWVLSGQSASLVCEWVSSLSKRAWKSGHPDFWGRFSRCLSLRSKLPFLSCPNLSLCVYGTNHCYHKPPKANNEI